MGARQPWTTGELARLRAMRAAGLSESACAAALGRSRGSVAGALRRMGLTEPAAAPRRKSGELRRVAPSLVRRLGVSWAADALGVSRQAVYDALARAGSRAPYGPQRRAG
jgi:hypothetical protein